MKKTKIVCTIGPACEDQKILEKMIRSGMNVARLNFSHGSYTHHQKLIKNIRAVSKKLNQSIAIIQDLQGPRIRIGNVTKSGIDLNKSDKVVLVQEKSINYKLLSKNIQFIMLFYTFYY